MPLFGLLKPGWARGAEGAEVREAAGATRHPFPQ